VSTLTFEFPDASKAQAFADAIGLHLRCTSSVVHRVVDVADVTDADPAVIQGARSFLVMLARKFGAVDGPRPFDLTRDERERLANLLLEICDATASPGSPYHLLDGKDMAALRKVLAIAAIA
jgi:hypothetical protein